MKMMDDQTLRGDLRHPSEHGNGRRIEELGLQATKKETCPRQWRQKMLTPKNPTARPPTRDGRNSHQQPRFLNF